MQRKFLLPGGVLYVGVASATYLYLRSTNARPGCPHAGADAAASPGGVFDRIAGEYDDKIGLDETLMGVGLLRRWLVRQARGEVLEVAGGTGRNLGFYRPPGVTSVTLTDASPPMLARAFDKHRATPGKVPVEFCLADVQHLCSPPAGPTANRVSAGGSGNAAQQRRGKGAFGPALDAPRAFPAGSFDTVVDTFGLCSCLDPVGALREMARALRPGGRLLLLEHGRSSWGFVNDILDSGAAQHCARWGCQWNRDIEGLVRQAGLQVERSSRWHLGTTYLLVARPASDDELSEPPEPV